MSDFESGFDTGRKSVGRKNDDTGNATTPHRSKRINLGTPANYYFKYMNSGKKSLNNDVSFSKDSDGDTGEISIPGFKLSTPSKGESSFFSIAESSSGSEASDDMLNKSTLSDTTELTASNFVLVTTSKQNMIRKNRDSFARVDNKENALNRKPAAVQNKPQPLVGGNSAVKKNHGEKADAKDQDAATAETKNNSKSKNDNIIEEVHISHQKSSVRSASPSLRSRISSSPASLRKFSENLKNSRMKRQMQREEDTKRRLSIEPSDTLDSISAQLDALTGGGLPKRDRLPPQFTQKSPFQKSPSASLRQSSAEESMDETATMELGDLDAFLGMKSSKTTKTRSDETTSGQENETSPSSMSRNEYESPPSVNASTKSDVTGNSFMSNEKSKSKFVRKDDPKETNVSKSVSAVQDVQQEYASPPMASPPAELSIQSNSRKRMTPSKLSSTPRRVVNPDSLFSPARNTRSATKKRKLAEQKEKEEKVSTENIVRSRRSSSIGTRLFQTASMSDNDTSMDSESSEKEGGTSPSNEDDTASLGDIADLFGVGKSMDESFESNVSPDSETKPKASDGQETASIGDINEILNLGVSYSEDSPKRKSFENPPTIKDKTSEESQKLTLDQNTATLDSEQLERKDESVEMEYASASKALKEGNNLSPNQNSVGAKESTPPRYDSPEDRHKSSAFHGKSPQPNLAPGGLSATKPFPKSPIRLTPNRHTKPTPTKLTPIPRRVMNPKNPNSPARNTRSSRKDKLLEDTELESKVLDRLTPERLSGVDENNKVEVATVLFSNNRRQSVSVVKQKPPIGILSSKKKQFPRRSVAFGSPEAAEYNIGSPSVSLTPMPKGRAKALFTLPGVLGRARDTGIDSAQEKTASNHDASIGYGMNILVDKITAEEMNHSPELSPIIQKKTPNGVLRSDEKEIQDSEVKESSFSGSPSEMRDSSVELTDSESIASIYSKGNKYTSDFVVPFQAQRLDFSVASDISENVDLAEEGKISQRAESTVELEGNMLSLLVATNGDKEDKENKRSDEMNITRDSSYSNQKDRSEQLIGTLKTITSKTDMEGDKTVELEGNMFSLLEATYGENEQSNTTDKMDATGVSEQFTGDIKNIMTKTGIQGDKTVELEGNMLSLLEAASGGKNNPKNDTMNEIETKSVSERFTVHEGEKTVELEGNMFSLLEATGAGQAQTANDTGDKMDTSEDLSSSIANDNTTVSEMFTGELKGGIEGDKTVELEGNMFSLLEATSRGKVDEFDDNETDKMDISQDSSSSVLEDNKAADEFKPSIEGEKTVELEGNMLSLLDAASNDRDAGKDNAPENEMDITSSSELKDDATESEHFTCNLNNMMTAKSVENDSAVDLDTVSSKAQETSRMSMESGHMDEIVTEVSVMHSRQRGTQDQLITSRLDSDDVEFEVSRNESGRKRRKSLSSNSFVVDRVDEVQSIVDDITTGHESTVFEKSVSFSNTTEFISALRNDQKPIQEPKSVDLPSITSMLLDGLKFQGQSEDILSKSSSRFGKVECSVDSILYERWSQFVDAVCGEVERRTEQEGTAAMSLGNNVHQDPRFYTMLQKRFQSSEYEGQMKQSMDGLVKAGHKVIEHDWNSWVTTVLESFPGVLSATEQMHANDSAKLENALQDVKKVEDNISLMNDMKTKLAREKSIRRQREATSTVEKEIESMEAQLAVAKSELLELDEEETTLLNTTKDHKKRIHDAKLYDELRVGAESSQKNFMSLNGLHSWSMRTVSESDLEFNTVGSCQQTHLKFKYEGSASGKATKIFSSKVDPANASKSVYVYHEPLSGFLDSSTKRLMETAQQSSETGPVQIGEHLQKYAWLAGRLDLIAKEFQVVQRRYNGILHRQSGEVFSFLVEFESAKSTVTADFRIESTYYPSFPIEVRLDLISGDQDLEVIKKSLLKNANPGFGSLSRACDIIQSIVRG